MKTVRKLLGQKIKNIRKQNGLTQEKFAELANIDLQTLSHIENGYTFPSKSLPNIAESLGVSLCELFDFEYLQYTCEQKKEFIIKSLDNISDLDIDFLFKFIKLRH